jgi:hypothetical protein
MNTCTGSIPSIRGPYFFSRPGRSSGWCHHESTCGSESHFCSSGKSDLWSARNETKLSNASSVVLHFRAAPERLLWGARLMRLTVRSWLEAIVNVGFQATEAVNQAAFSYASPSQLPLMFLNGWPLTSPATGHCSALSARSSHCRGTQDGPYTRWSRCDASNEGSIPGLSECPTRCPVSGQADKQRRHITGRAY